VTTAPYRRVPGVWRSWLIDMRSVPADPSWQRRILVGLRAGNCEKWLPKRKCPSDAGRNGQDFVVYQGCPEQKRLLNGRGLQKKWGFILLILRQTHRLPAAGCQDLSATSRTALFATATVPPALATPVTGFQLHSAIRYLLHPT